MDEALSNIDLFAEPEENTNAPAKLSHQDLARLSHEELKCLEYFNQRSRKSENWLTAILRRGVSTSSDTIVRIVKIPIDGNCVTFHFTEYTDILTGNNLRTTFPDQKMLISAVDSEPQNSAILTEIIDHQVLDETVRIICIFWPSTWLNTDRTISLILRYTASATIKINSDHLYRVLTRHFPDVLTVTPSQLPLEIAYPELSTHSQGLDLRETIKSLSRRVDDLTDYVAAVSNAYQRSNLFANAILSVLEQEKRDRLRTNEDFRNRFGHMHEELIRHATSFAYGFEYAMPLTINSFLEAINFVGRGLGKSPKEIELATRYLIRTLTKGVDVDYEEKLWETAKEPTFFKKFQQSSTYMKLLVWTRVALSTVGVARSKFYGTLLSIAQWDVAGRKEIQKLQIRPQELLTAMLEQDSSYCLILIWFHINADEYIPDASLPFRKWNIPTNVLQFDHRGTFKDISANQHLYEGAESKGNYTNYEEAKKQLLRRFILIDAMGVYAFRSQIHFKGIVFVPDYPPEKEVEERVALPWRKAPPSVGSSADTTGSWISDDVRMMVPDLYHCTMRLALAPVCIGKV